MALVTAPDGTQAEINVDKISAVSNDPATGRAEVFGLNRAALPTNETAAALVNRLGLGNVLAQLTRADGSPVWISGKAASMVAQSGGGAAIVVAGMQLPQQVTENVAAAAAALNAYGGRF
jgi:hypothetical protein